MENKAKLLMEIGLQRDEDHGDVSVVAFDVPIGVAKRVCEEQEQCALLSESGELTKLLNSYALVNGYQCAWFISANMEEYSDDQMSENAVLRETVLFLQIELEDARKDARKDALAHELAGKLFEMKNTQLEKKLEKADAERMDAVKKAICRMRDELKRGRIHFDGIGFRAIPFDSVDAVAERIIKETADGK